MSVGGAAGGASSNSDGKSNSKTAFVPSPRMKPGLTVCKGQLYLYGGVFEQGNKQFTLNDLYTLGKWKRFT